MTKNDAIEKNRLHRKKQYSRMVIRKAFLELLEKQPLSKITVKEVCDLADVNRTTFYGNFYDLYDLLEQIQNELFERIEATVKKAKYGAESLFEIFEIVKENIDLCKILFSTNNGQDFINKVIMIPASHLIGEWTATAKLDDDKLMYLFEFCANGCVAFLRRWVTEETKMPAREAATLLQVLVSSNVKSIVGK